MASPVNLQADVLSLVHQFMLTVDKSLAADIFKKTKAVSTLTKKPRVGTWKPTRVLSFGLITS